MLTLTCHCVRASVKPEISWCFTLLQVILGGGRKQFLPTNATSPDTAKRLDGRDLVQV